MKSLKKALGSSKDTDLDTASSPNQPLFQPTLNPGNHGTFPDTFSIYLSRVTKERKTKKFDYFYLVLEKEDKKVEPLNIISFDKRTSDHKLTLYSDTKCSSAPLAHAGSESRFGSVHQTITLPARHENLNGTETTNSIIHLETDNSQKERIYRFKLDVGGDQEPETFEWRTSVRTATGTEPEPHPETGTDNPSQPESEQKPKKDKAFRCRLVRLTNSPTSGQGEELVATWVEGNTPRMAAKIGTFRFENSATTRHLGPYGTLAAVVSLLRIIQLRWMKLAAADSVKRVAKKSIYRFIFATAVGQAGGSPYYI